MTSLSEGDGAAAAVDVVDAVLRARRSVRAYRPDPVPREQVHAILAAAATAPSNSNTQPWHVHVLTGAPLRALGEQLVAAATQGEASALPPSPHFPEPLPEALGARQAAFAERYYGALGIDRNDAAARARQSLRNYTFFGAPVGLIVSIDARLRPHSWVDLGLFLQGLMLAAKARGLDTCPQVSFARCHPVIAPFLQLPPEEVTVCGMALGVGDPDAPVNRMAMPRRPVDEFARWRGFDA